MTELGQTVEKLGNAENPNDKAKKLSGEMLDLVDKMAEMDLSHQENPDSSITLEDFRKIFLEIDNKIKEAEEIFASDTITKGIKDTYWGRYEIYHDMKARIIKSFQKEK